MQLSLAKFILIFKHSVRLRRNLLRGGVVACPGMECVFCAVQNTAHSVIKWRQIWIIDASYACGREERFLVGKTEGNSPYELPWRSWKDIRIQNTLRWEEVDFINLVWDRDKWLALVNAVMNNMIS